MADFGQIAQNVGGNYLLGRAGQALGVPTPTMSEINMIRGGQGGRAVRHFAGRQGGGLLGAGIGAALGGPIGAFAGRQLGGWLGGHFVPLITGHGWNDDQGYGQVGTVGGTPATVTSTGTSANGLTIDPWTGQQISNTGINGNDSPWLSGPYSMDPNATSMGPPTPEDASNGPRNHEQISEDRDNGGGFIPAMQGVTNFMVGGFPVINGVRPAGGDMNQAAVLNWRRYGGN